MGVKTDANNYTAVHSHIHNVITYILVLGESGSVFLSGNYEFLTRMYGLSGASG